VYIVNVKDIENKQADKNVRKNTICKSRQKLR